MTDDDFFDDELDSEILKQLDAIESAATAQDIASDNKRNAPPVASNQRSNPDVIELSDSDDYGSFSVDAAQLQQIDNICAQHLQGQSSKSIAGPSRTSFAQRPSSKGSVQTTLFGEILQPSAQGPKRTFQRTHSKAPPREEKRTKQWDHTAFAKTGWRASKSAGKGKSSFDGDDEEAEQDEVEFEQFPAPVVSIEPPPPMKLAPDLLAARRWIYPLNKPKRDYQVNIVSGSLFENTLVALPTGLGKTFIAGVIMLNYYTWFPDGKVIFVAPTKPLVAQQIDACHKVCGIPGSHAAELTGQVPGPRRMKAWEEKRVFFMTPQTLMNDLRNGNCDPRDIILLVIDEAHKGTGDYAYAQVVRYLMAKNPHFRVLALTATPGSDIEAVQRVVDSLHISHIEMRSEKSPDIVPYLHMKHVKLHTTMMSQEYAKLRDMLAAIMQPLLKLVQGNGLLQGNPDPVMLHPFRCQKAMGEMHVRKAPRHLFSPISQLGKLARAMGYLTENSMGMFYNSITSIITGEDESAEKKSSGKAAQGALAKNPQFQALLREAEEKKNSGFPLHPKMDKMKTLLLDHFVRDAPENDDGQLTEGGKDSRVMIFSTFRECVDEIVAYLNLESPLIRATRFIGQGVDKQGKKGFAQSEQLEVISKFKAGEYNVLVSTSIGEEGLDIGEVDMIICYDAQKTPIRMLQRVGRTGRKRAGYVHVLLSEGREEKNWDKAQSSYDEVQFSIEHCDKLEFYGDVERLLPANAKPECVEMVMDIEEHVREEPKSRKGSMKQSPSSKGNKRKRDDDPGRNIPPGAAMGFVTVKDLIVKGTKKRKKAEQPFDALLGQDDDDDIDIEAGLDAPRRTMSASAIFAPAKSKGKLKRTLTTIDEEGGKKPPKGKKNGKTGSRKGNKPVKEPSTPTASQFDKVGADDSDDNEIEKGLRLSSPRPLNSPLRLQSIPPLSSPSVTRSPSPPTLSLSPEVPYTADVVDLTTPITDRRANYPAADRGPTFNEPRKKSQSAGSSTSERPSTSLEDSSPQPERSSSVSSRGPSPPKTCDPDTSIAWLIADDDEPSIQLIGSSPVIPLKPELHVDASDNESDLEFVDDLPPPPLESSPRRTLRPRAMSPASPVQRAVVTVSSPHQDEIDMPPPALPARPTIPSPASDEFAPAPTYAPRAPGRQAKKRSAGQAFGSSPLAMPPPSQRRLQRLHDSSSPPPPVRSPSLQPKQPKRKKRVFRDITEAQRANPWIDVEAVHSGEEEGAFGSSDADEMGSESDRAFVVDEPSETQAPSSSYDQSAVYRRSLFTQAPGSTAVMPRFATARRGGMPRGGGGEGDRRVVLSSSSPPRDGEDDGQDEYMFGSFVVEDDAEISFANDLSSES